MKPDILNRIAIAGIIVLGAVTLLLLYLPGGPGGRPVETTEQQAAIGGPFTLVNQDGETVTDQDFRGKYMLVFFGFTHCPDICPMTLQKISDALSELPDQQAEQFVPVLVSVDPARDTPEALADYVSYFDPRTVGLTGTAEQVAAAASAYRVYYNKVDLGDGDYTMDHSGFTYIMGPRGRYLTHFSASSDVDQIISKLKSVL